jgi:enoyl-CoA hydratase/carnithine racemase
MGGRRRVTEIVVVETVGEVLVVRMNRAAKRNAVDAALTAGIDAALNRLEDDPALRVGILTGTPTVFSAGTDMYDPGEKITERGGEYGVIRRVRRKPLIAAVEGYAVGGGFEIVLSCDLVVASTTALFGLPETLRGLVATSGALFRAPRALPLHVATELLLTGALLDADRAYVLGLVNAVTEPGQAVDGALRLAAQICGSGPTAVAETLTALRELTGATDKAGWAATDRARSAVLASPDADEGRQAFAEKRQPRWASQ